MSTSSSPPTPPTLTLAEVYGLVVCTPADGVDLLNKLAESEADRSPGLVDSINKAITELQGMTVTAAEEAAEEEAPEV